MQMKMQMKMSQQLIMTPQLQQAIKLLQLSSIDLAAYIERELQENPMLEREELVHDDSSDDPINVHAEELVNDNAPDPVGLEIIDFKKPLEALVKKISGVIVDGPVRDIDESAELKFPVFARSAIPTTARGRIVEEAFNKPITIGEVIVKPGDLALADGSGICFLAQEHASRLIETAELIA